MVNVSVSPKTLEDHSMTVSQDRAARDNRANQLNPEHPSYWLSRGQCHTAACQYAIARREQHARRVTRGAASPITSKAPKR